MRLRARVEAEHGGDRVVQLVGQRDRAGARAERADRMMLVLLELDAERILELGDGAGQLHHALHRIDALHRQLVPLGERLGVLDIVRPGAETLGEILARYRLGGRIAAGELVDQRVERLFSLASQHHRHVDPLGGIACADALRFRDDLRFAAGVKMPCHVVTLLDTVLHGLRKIRPALPDSVPAG